VNLALIRKFLAALSGAVAVAVANGLLPDPYAKWVSSGLAVITAFIVFFVPNEPTPPGNHQQK
jgi:hypothetical protein